MEVYRYLIEVVARDGRLDEAHELATAARARLAERRDPAIRLSAAHRSGAARGRHRRERGGPHQARPIAHNRVHSRRCSWGFSSVQIRGGKKER